MSDFGGPAPATGAATSGQQSADSSSAGAIPYWPLHPEDDAHPSVVVGRAFPLSPSVQRSLRVVPDVELSKRLNEFAQEPRDPQWASTVEAHLQQVLGANANLTPREIECRTSMCVFEIAYIGPQTDNIYSDRFLLNHVKLEDNTWGYESDPTHQRISVALEVLRRQD